MKHIVLSVLLVLVAASCGTSLENRSEALQDAVVDFNDNIRWQRYRQASQHLPLARQDSWLRAMENAGRFFIVSDYDVTPVMAGKEKATVQVDLTYHRVGGVVLETTRRQQEWTWTGRSWMLVSEREIPVEDLPPPTGLPELTAEVPARVTP